MEKKNRRKNIQPQCIDLTGTEYESATGPPPAVWQISSQFSTSSVRSAHRASGRFRNPDPTVWAQEAEPARRAQRGLEERYAFFSRTSRMFEKIYRDLDEYAPLKKIMDRFDAHLRHVADSLAAAWPGEAAVRRQVVLRHAVKFATWQSFEADGVNDKQKVALIIQWLSADLCGGQ